MNDFDDSEAFEAAQRPQVPPVPQVPQVPLSQRARAPAPARYLDDLNPAQREAVEHLDGPVLMLAGAGTGKTKALTARIAHLINQGRASAQHILAVTFTNKAAREMKNRVGNSLGYGAEGMRWMGTFHALCVRMLRRHAELVGLKSNFVILDTDDQKRLLKQLIVAAEMDPKRWTPRHLSAIIDGWKNRAFTPANLPTAEASAFDGQGPALYAQYQERLRVLNACDFGDLLLHMVVIFQNHDDLLRDYQSQFKYILVDEYQDTNVAQYMWLRLLAQRGDAPANICCVGDDDQSIYGWRGAEVGNILRFEKDFPGAHVVRLEQNYRSTPHILAAASRVIAGNANRLGKTLWTAREEGEKLRLNGYWDGDEEARGVGEEAEALQRGTRGMAGKSLEDMAILVRASHQMRVFEERFVSIGLPYRVIGGPRFYERQEIRDAMAYFRLVISPADDLAFERIINVPKRGVGAKAMQTIQVFARNAGVGLLEATGQLLAAGEIRGKARTELAVFMETYARWAALAGRASDGFGAGFGAGATVGATVGTGSDDAGDAEEDALFEDLDAPEMSPGQGPQTSHVDLAKMILEESGYTDMWQNDKSPEAPGRLENLMELIKALEDFENLQGFLEHVALIMENDSGETEEKLTIMTLHAAKGLEFPVVFLPGWEEGIFPSQRSLEESGQVGLEEERRLAYVGITRAEEICNISFAGNRRVFGQWQNQMASRFVDELPPEHVEVLSPPGLGGSSGASGGYGQVTPAESSGGATARDMQDRAVNADSWNSPGWKRMQARTTAGYRGAAAPRAKCRNLMVDGTVVVAFSAGDRVFQQKFGYGTVLGVEADTLDVEFDKAGAKKVKAGFVVAAERAGDVPF